MTFSTIQNSFIGGEISPSLFGRTDLAKWHNGASTMRNFFSNYRGGAASRAGFAYVGTCLQPANSTNPPRDIPFQFNISQGYALEFGDNIVTVAVTGAANNGSGAVRLTIVTTALLFNGNSMTVSGVGGVTGANGTFSINIIDGTHVDLIGSTFSGSYTSGGSTSTSAGYMRVKYRGAYVIEAANDITNITQANPGIFSYTNTNYTLHNGDWIFVQNIGGMTNFNGLVWIVQNLSGSTFSVTDLFGDPVDTSSFGAFTSNGTLSRIYTTAAPYAAVDLPYLKYTQSADTMSLTCVNPQTPTEYPTYDLVRNGNTNWVFTAVAFASSTVAPTNLVATAHNSTTATTYYSYVVTAIDATTGEESVASNISTVHNNDIATAAGSNSLVWSPVANASSYNVYTAQPSFGLTTPPGVLYGFIGTALSTSFVDTNIIADFTKVPPLNFNPFARGQITDVTITAGGASYTQSTVGFTITSSTGSGFTGTPIVNSGAVTSFLITSPGSGYTNSDTITITDSGSGSGATATLTIGSQAGTYPSTVAYYQQRRVYADTLNQPDTYFMSQPGAFTNMDISTPTTDSDAIIGAPWAQQINGIQFMVPMTTGLIMLTGTGAWLVNGGNSSAITPSDQTATAQSYNGCNSIVQPILINYDILYVQDKGSIVRDLSFNFFVNIFTGTDKTVLSSHLFNYHQILQWAYAEEPYKLVWAIRDDGIMLCLTWLKEQDVYAWSRHDTNGFFVGVCSIIEPPVDAIYVITKRYIQGAWRYYSERMDNRNWVNPEGCFCVDAGLQYPMTFPSATLIPSAADGTENISSVNIISGGSNYTAPIINAIDKTGQGTGATFSATLTGGVITGVTPLTQGQDYVTGQTILEVIDSTGSGADLQPIITNIVTFNASSSVFDSDDVGSVIRIGNNNAATNINGGIVNNGGGKAIITSYVSGTQVLADIIQPITAVVTDDPNNTPIPANSGYWSLSVPTTTVTGLNHLEGMTVAILADGSVIPNATVMNGAITLPQAYSAISIGLPYTCQLQTLYLEPGNTSGTIQGKRKNIYNVSVRCELTRGIQSGTNQPDQSTQPNYATAPWTNMKEVKERNASVRAGADIPLFTGDFFQNLPSNWDTSGQVAIQQTYPLPANILAVITNYVPGDTPG